MSAVHLHLLLTHVPVLGTVFGVLLLAYSLWRKQEAIQRVSFGVFVLSGLTAWVVYLTGEGAEEAVESLAGVSHAIVEAHEEAAFFAFVAALVLGGVSLGGLLLARFSKNLARWTALVVLVLGIVRRGLTGWTANLGGQINHPEIRGDATTALPASTQDEEHGSERDD